MAVNSSLKASWLLALNVLIVKVCKAQACALQSHLAVKVNFSVLLSLLDKLLGQPLLTVNQTPELEICSSMPRSMSQM